MLHAEPQAVQAPQHIQHTCTEKLPCRGKGGREGGLPGEGGHASAEHSHLKAGVNEAHVLLDGVIEGWARHAATPQHSHGLITAAPMIHHLTPRQHIRLVEEAAGVC